MSFKYNLTAVGVRTDFPYVLLDEKCLKLQCLYPGAEVEFLRHNLKMINATVTLVPTKMNADEMIDMRNIEKAYFETCWGLRLAYVL
ncbi:unnamed protein product [Strongylus vulgaris]|uniref:Uncharacterized protein n=1 Tax=Strongylus vulgaris TaxID=40348 RepID=A0A3P7JYF8_STRVU|nr:unnamed protein product [Strongylus vulgaris]